MNSQERHKLIRKMYNLFRIAWFSGFGMVGVGAYLRISNDDTSLWYALLCTIFLLGGVFMLIILHFIGTDISLKLRQEKGRLKYEKFNMYISRFYVLINNKKLNEAFDYFNNFISISSSKSIDKISSDIALGILLGVSKENYDILETDKAKAIKKRLNKISNRD